MARKKSSPTKKASSPGKKGAQLSGPPGTGVLARYSPTDSAHSHPDWVKQQFPDYVGAHAGHETTVVREFAHGGHAVKILTTYRVEVDGLPVRAHLAVDEDGRVYSHATPFETYASALELMRAVIDAYPDSFPGTAGDRGTGGHHGHGGHP